MAKMSLSANRKVTLSTNVIPPAAFSALDRLGEPGARLILFGDQNYILSEKIRMAHSITNKTLAMLQAQEWVTCAQRTDQGLECRLTPAGWKVINQRKAARCSIENLVQLELVLQEA